VHICFFNRSYWPDQAATGQLLTELAEDLVGRFGCRVTVVAGRALNASEAQVRTWKPVTLEMRNGVEIVRANGTCFSPRRVAGRASNYLTYFISALAASFRVGRPDLVVSLTDPPIVGLSALFAARRAGARFVYLCEDVFPEVAVLLEDFHNPVVNWTLDRVNRSLIARADAVVALGDRMRERLIEGKGAAPGRIHVIHNWADCAAITPGLRHNAFAREHGLLNRFVVMHSGNVGLSQNLEVIVEAAARLRSREEIVFLIVGDGSLKPSLEGAVRERGLANVRFLPYQPKERLHESFATADVFLVSLKDGLEGYIVPSKLYGILAAGRPYIAAVNASCEVATLAAEHGCGVPATPGDPVDLAEQIAALSDDPLRARQMGACARRAAMRFDRQVAVRSYYDLFARLLERRRAA
jgi:glycosyltransferase involved in cell wall biosynthesis